MTLLSLLPKNVMGLHSDDPDLKAYLGTIPGSGPENMPWDLSLNKDAHEDTNRHAVLTHELAEDDPRKFDLSTPKRGSWVNQRVLQICPGSARIKQDVLKVFHSMEKVRKAGGILVEGLGKNYGRRYENVRISVGAIDHEGWLETITEKGRGKCMMMQRRQ
jgi:hypothetical protein